MFRNQYSLNLLKKGEITLAKYVSLGNLELLLSNFKNLFVTKSEISNKSDTGHTHDDRYYTEEEINTKVDELTTAINGKASSSHTHNMSDMSDLEDKINEIDESFSNKSLIQFVTWEEGD